MGECDLCCIPGVGVDRWECSKHGVEWRLYTGLDRRGRVTPDHCPAYAAKIEGVRLGLEAGEDAVSSAYHPDMDSCCGAVLDLASDALEALDPEAIAKGADRG